MLMECRGRCGRVNIAAGIAIGIAVGTATNAHAQTLPSFPSKPIRFIVPFPPGGSADSIARLVGIEMTKTFGQPVLVENRPGGGGTIGVDIALKAPADGYTIFLAPAGAVAINLSLMPKLPYDPLKDIQPITMLATIPIVLAVAASSPIQNVQALIAHAKAQPGALSYASAGNGTAMHLSAELFRLMTKTDMTHIPYRGSGPGVTDLISGQVPLGFVDLSSALPHIRAGRVRALATAGATRSITAPEIPTIAEQGVPGFDALGWFGVAGPIGLPADVLTRLNTEIQRAMRVDDIRTRSLALGAEPLTGTPQAFGAFIRAEIPKWANVIKASGARLD